MGFRLEVASCRWPVRGQIGESLVWLHLTLSYLLECIAGRFCFGPGISGGRYENYSFKHR